MGTTILGYAYDPHLSYEDHLRVRDSVASGATKVASQVTQSVSRESQRIGHAVSEGMSRVGARLSDIDDSLARLDSTVEWGFSQILTKLNGMQQGLDQLIEIARSPAHTHALEHFEQARRNYHNALYPECLTRLNHAIHGDNASPGWKEDYRFYQLAGTVYLECPDRSLIDLQKAESYFLSAARYARAEHPYEAAGSLVAAGVAAYSQGKMKDALRCEREAYSLISNLGEAYFQAAKILVFVEQFDSAYPLIRRALECDIGYARKLPDDGEFRRHSKAISPFWTDVGEQTRLRLESLARDVRSTLTYMEQWETNYKNTPMLEVQNLGKQRKWRTLLQSCLVRRDWYRLLPLTVRVRAGLSPQASFQSTVHSLRTKPCFADDRGACERAYGVFQKNRDAAATKYGNAVALVKERTVHAYLVAEKELVAAAPLAAAAKSKTAQIDTTVSTVETAATAKATQSLVSLACGCGAGVVLGLLLMWLLFGALFPSTVFGWIWLIIVATVGLLNGHGRSRRIWGYS